MRGLPPTRRSRLFRRGATATSGRGPVSGDPRRRIGLVGLAIGCLFAAMLTRLWYLQVLEAPTFAEAAVANQVRVVTDAAPRGLILDAAGQPLVTDRPTEVVTLSRSAAAAHPGVKARLARALGMTVAAVDARLADSQFSPYEPVPVRSGVPTSTIIFIREHQSEFPGVSTTLMALRAYPYGPLAAQLLGYVGEVSAAQLKSLSAKGYRAGESIGESGVEGAFEKWLRGKPGETRLEVDAAGNVVGTLGSAPPVPGDNVRLTLDLGLQKALDSALASHIKAIRGTIDPTSGLRIPASGGAAVVLDPRNGNVLAMASYPSYDPSVWVGGISQAAYNSLTSPSSEYPLVNRAIQGLYTPGSTFKIATATAALDSGLISPGTEIDDTGTFHIPNCTGRCTFHNAGFEALGWLDVVKAIAASDDVFFYNLGYDFYVQQARYGATPIQDMANEYGLGVPTGIDIPGEVVGRVDSPAVRQKLHALYPKAYPYDSWYAGDNLELAFGQGGTVITPLELATAYATFANGGTRYAPQVASEVLDSTTGKVVHTFAPKVMAHVNLPPTVRDTMLQGFEDEVSAPYGTGYGAFAGFPLARFPIAGKTGTASVAGQEPTALWVGFAPANDPRYVVAVVVDHGGYGATGAAPIARSAFQYLMNHPARY